MNLTLFVTVLITAVMLVVAALGIALLISPRSFNKQKGEAYECGIPTRGKSWMQFKVGYYLFAILFLMFDVEAVFLFPWAVILREVGVEGLVTIIFFLFILVLGEIRGLQGQRIPGDLCKTAARGRACRDRRSGRTDQLGAFQFALAADVRYELLRYRVHVGRRRPV